MTLVADSFEFLLGSWRLERSIDDRRSGVSGTFSGEAVVEALAAGRARYEERGQLRFGARRSPAHRALDYVRLEGGAVLFCFTDGRPYIEIELRSGSCRRIHDCVQDRYEIELVVFSAEQMRERWRVTGPNKDYSATTVLTRSETGMRHTSAGASMTRR